MIKPDIIFQVVIPETERNRRVEERGETLSIRDERLRDDEIYRKELESEREKHGCNIEIKKSRTRNMRTGLSKLCWDMRESNH